MPLSRREIRTHATEFTKQWAGDTEEGPDAKPFWHGFLNIFSIRARSVSSYRMHVRKLDKALDKCYRPQAFTNDAKRVEFLYELYER